MSTDLPTADATTNSNGIATAPAFVANTKIGMYKVRASVSNVSTVAEFNLTNKAGPADTINVVAGTLQMRPVGTPYATLQAIVRDRYSNPVQNAIVNFSAPFFEPTGRFPSNSRTYRGVSDIDGFVFAATFTAGRRPGGFVVDAKVENTNVATFFALQNVAGAAAQTTIVAGSRQGTLINTVFPSLLRAQVQDQFGNPVSGTVVTFTAPNNGASGKFANNSLVTTATSNSDGYAKSSDFTANATVGTYNVTSTISGTSSLTNFELTNLAACAQATPANRVTSPSDNGSDVTCGKLSRALLEARGTPSQPYTITFALTAGNTISVTGKLPPVRDNIVLSGNSCQNGRPSVILDGKATQNANPTTIINGLELLGRVTLRNLKITNFKDHQVIAQGGQNLLQCVIATDRS